MKVISRILIKVLERIEGKRFSEFGLVESIGYCNIYKGTYKPRTTTGNVISSRTYKNPNLAMKARRDNTKSVYVSTKQLFITID